MGHNKIEKEAVRVAQAKQAPRCVLKDPGPNISPEMLMGILKNGRVSGYSKGTVHRGTFYRECEGVQYYKGETFLRVVMYGDEFHDTETRIPLQALIDAGFLPPLQPADDGSQG